MPEWKNIKRGNYGRRVSIAVEADECDLCHLTGPVLMVDTSDGEYSYLQICAKCVAQQFEEIKVA